MGACHGNLNGKGGFRLSLRGDDPAFDHASLSRDASGRRVSLIAPERSLVLLKPTGLVAARRRKAVRPPIRSRPRRL